MSKPKKMAQCHPDKRNVASGLCKRCYEKKRYSESPSRKARIIASKKLRREMGNSEYLTTVYRLYGLHPDDYKKLYDKQDGKCAICKQPEKLVVDHRHGTEVVRGLLCTRCNLTLGLLEGPHKDAALAYLGIGDNFTNHLKDVVNETWNFSKRLDTPEKHEMNAFVGLASEAGETLDIIKKKQFHTEKPSEEFREKLLYELGDIIYYWLKAVELCGFTHTEVIEGNREKLASRHPELGKVKERFSGDYIR